MNERYYSDRTVKHFVEHTICKGDQTLLRYLENDDAKAFRRRLAILKVPPKDIEKVVYSYVTDSVRDIILKSIARITRYMRPLGDLVISGGEAFNAYFERNDRVMTSDIDTKFVPNPSGNTFQNIQVAKLLLWDYLGKLASEIEPHVRARVEGLKATRVGKVLGISLPQKNPVVTRRYTLIRKHKQSSNNSREITPSDVLIDVELMTLDLKVRYFSTSDQKISERNLGGILDIAFMRPGELGYEVASNRERGLFFVNMIGNRILYERDILVASKRFLVEDLYLMQSLGLRPEKAQKDRKRMYVFCKKVLGIGDITSTTPIETLFKKALSKLPSKKVIGKRVPVSRKYLIQAMRVNPYRWVTRTTEPRQGQITIGIKGPKGISSDRFKPTSGMYRFDLKTKKWVVNKRNTYIKNEANYRAPLKNENKVTRFPLYGYNPRRDKNIPKKLIRLAATIPLVGLKK